MVPQQPEPIAIVGSGCRFPGSSSSPSSLWKLLEKPRDVSKEIPNERFELQGYYHPKGSHHGTTNVQRSYTLDEDVRIFDAKFFNISPNEADSMDPQQRLLMEAVYEAPTQPSLSVLCPSTTTTSLCEISTAHPLTLRLALPALFSRTEYRTSSIGMDPP